MEKIILIKNQKHKIQPPDPLPQRNLIPLPSPKFGKNIAYM